MDNATRYDFYHAKWDKFSPTIKDMARKYMESPEAQEAIREIKESVAEVCQRKGRDLPRRWRFLVIPEISEEDHQSAEAGRLDHIKLAIYLVDFFAHELSGKDSILLKMPVEKPVVYLPIPQWTMAHGEEMGDYAYATGLYVLTSEANPQLSEFIKKLQKLEKALQPGKKRKASMFPEI